VEPLGAADRATDTRTIVVYDRKSGDVVHVHRFVSVGPGPIPSDAELEHHALALAVEGLRTSAGNLAALRVPTTDLVPGAEQRVDAKTKQLVVVRQLSLASFLDGGKARPGALRKAERT